MTRFILLIVFTLGHTLAPAVAQQAAPENAETQSIPDTLMFTIDELNEINSRVATGGSEAGRNQASIENASLYLSTILYTSPSEWTIWVNGVPITPQQEFPQFQVTDIGPSHVELLVPLSAQGMRPVRLAPNQTFVARSGSVIEGRWK